MKIVETRNIDKSGYEYHGKGSISVVVTTEAGEKETVTIHAGEPEDAVFFCDLDGAYSIADAVKLAYEAGLRGETLEYEFIDENEAEE
ncbi:hypothetical protein ACX93W_01740 [Paenibacillus sp. CAU 1782]